MEGIGNNQSNEMVNSAIRFVTGAVMSPTLVLLLDLQASWAEPLDLRS